MAAQGRQTRLRSGSLLSLGKSVRRRALAVLVRVTTVLTLLLEVEASPTTMATARIWATVIIAGLGLVARGRLYRAVRPGCVDAWVTTSLGAAGQSSRAPWARRRSQRSNERDRSSAGGCQRLVEHQAFP